jgi:hypothetical protein
MQRLGSLKLADLLGTQKSVINNDIPPATGHGNPASLTIIEKPATSP